MAPPKPEGQSRLILLLIAGTPVVIILAASWLWVFVAEGKLDLIGTVGTSNNGTLITPPRNLAGVVLADDMGAQRRWSDLDRRWMMVVVSKGERCDRQCERRLYVTRQLHIALGKGFNRVKRVFISDHAIGDLTVAVPREDQLGWSALLTGDRLIDYLTVSHQGLVPLSVSPEVLDAQFPELATSTTQWFLVDPAGWIMMRFDDTLSYKAVIKDLTFLLKHSGDAT